MDRGGRVEPFSGSVTSGEGVFEDNFHPQPQNLFWGAAAVATGFKAAVAMEARATVTEVLALVVFSLRLSLEAVVDMGVESEVVTEGEPTSRERQTSFINFSSNSLHKGTI